MALREVLAHFGITVDDSGLKKADASIGDTISGVLSLGTAMAGIGGIVSFTKGLISVGAALDDAAQRSRGNVHDIQMWKYAAERSGTSAEEFGAAMKFLNKNIAEAAEGGGTAGPVFQKMGIKIKDSEGKFRKTSDVLLDVADGMVKIESGAQRTQIAMQLFGKGGTAALGFLNQGSKDIKKLLQRFDDLGGGFTKEFTDAAAQADDAMDDLGVVMKTIKNRIGVELLPTVAKGVERFLDFAVAGVKASKDTNVFRVGLGLLGGTSIITGVKLAAGAASKLGLIPSLAGKASGGIWGTTRAFLAMGKAALGLGLKLGIAFLIIEDLYTLFTGGKSAIGAFIDGFLGAGTAAAAVKEIKATFGGLIDKIKEGAPAIKEFVKTGMELLKDAFHGFESTRKLMSEFFEQLSKDLRESSGFMADLAFNYAKLFAPKIKGGKGGDFQKGADADKAFRQAEDDAVYQGLLESGKFGAVSPAQTQALSQRNNTVIQVNTPEAAAAVAKVQKEVNQDNAAALKAVVRP